MTKEDKELLLKDLCSRLPYKPRVCYTEVTGQNIERLLSFDYLRLFSKYARFFMDNRKIYNIVPYLRPMSSMTEEEKKEYHQIILKSQECSFENGESATTIVNDWLLSKHFDIRGLIPKGLAIEVTEENNPYKV